MRITEVTGEATDHWTCRRGERREDNEHEVEAEKGEVKRREER